MITLKRAEKDRSDGICSSCGGNAYADFVIETNSFAIVRNVRQVIALCKLHANVLFLTLKEFKREDELDGDNWAPKLKKKKRA